jgi:hypothetical protein
MPRLVGKNPPFAGLWAATMGGEKGPSSRQVPDLYSVSITVSRHRAHTRAWEKSAARAQAPALNCARHSGVENVLIKASPSPLTSPYGNSSPETPGWISSAGPNGWEILG